jgi:Xaa-Pro aminopeptidase
MTYRPIKLMIHSVLATAILTAASWPLTGITGEPPGSGRITAEEFQTRRQAVMERLDDGITLLHARSWFAGYDQVFVHGFQQNPGFYYLTGLESVVGAILALDGLSGESWLFVPEKLSGMAGELNKPRIAASVETAAELMLGHVVNWNEFIAFIDERVEQHPGLALYTDRPYIEPPQSNPPGLAPVDDPYLLWREALKQKWPALQHRSAAGVLTELRLVKSPAEIEVNRDVGRVSAQALLAGLRAIEPGKRQRDAEAAIVAECVLSGGEGPSFWPWVMSGLESQMPGPMEAFADYRHLDRIMQPGELARVDLGCDVDFYKGDVGRTVPVSGQFSPGQKEAWNLFVTAYKAGRGMMRDGATIEEIAQAAKREVGRHQHFLSTDLGKKAAQRLLGNNGEVLWHIHGSGLEPGEGRPHVLKSGMIIEFEPMFELEGQGYYLEDMILITEDGHEVLTEGLPYTATEIEAAMADGKNEEIE